MKFDKRMVCGAAIAALMLANGVSAYADVPTTVAFSGNLADANGPIEGNVQVKFRLFDAASNGAELWTETHDLVASQGVILAELGSEGSPLDDVVFDGNDSWLEVEVDGEVLTPRSPIGSVPYAISAAVADRVGDLAPGDLQERVSGTCNSGSAIASIASDGTVTCESDDDTTYSAGFGVDLTGTTFSVDTAAVQQRVIGTCAAGTSIRAVSVNGTVTCETDNDTIYSAGFGVNLTGTTFSADTAEVQQRVASTCAAGSSIRAIASNGTVTCEPDSVGTGDITGVTAGSGLTGGGTSGSPTLSVAATEFHSLGPSNLSDTSTRHICMLATVGPNSNCFATPPAPPFTSTWTLQYINGANCSYVCF